MVRSGKVILLNISGADWQQIHPLVDSGQMPGMAALVEGGCIGNLWAPRPLARPIPAMSLATGFHADKHRAFGQLLPDDDRGARPLEPADIPPAALWDTAAAQDLRARAVGWPGTHPAQTGGALVISDDFAAPGGRTFEDWPVNRAALSNPTLAETLAEARLHPSEVTVEMVQPFIPALANLDQDTDPRLLRYLTVFARAMSVHGAATWAAEGDDWDLLAVHFDFIEHLSAIFMQYQAPQMGHVSDADATLYSDIVAGSYVFLDSLIQRYVELLPQGAHLILTSDHGYLRGPARPKLGNNAPDPVTPQYRDLGIFLVSGPQARVDEAIAGATVFDIAPTTLALIGAKVPEDLPGKVLSEALQAPFPFETCPSIPTPRRHMDEQPERRMETLLDEMTTIGYAKPPQGSTAQIASVLTVRNLLREAEAFSGLGQGPAAMDVLKEALGLEPDNAAALRMSLNLALNSKKIDTATALFSRLSKAAPFALDLSVLAGELAIASGEKDTAQVHFEQALEDLPSGAAGAALRLRIGAGQLRTGALPQAETQSRAVLDRNPDDLPALKGLGEALALQKRFPEAISALRSALVGKSKQLGVQMLLAKCHLVIGEFDKARAAVDAALMMAPGHPACERLRNRIIERDTQAVIEFSQRSAP